MFSEGYRKKIIDEFQRRMTEIGILGEEVSEKLSMYSGDVKDALYLLYGRMPLSDMADYPVEIFADFAEWGAKLWKNNIFASKIPEEFFASYVLFHRVNDEEIEPCRKFFGKEMQYMLAALQEKIGKGDDLVSQITEAVLKINYWCAGEVSYHQEDDRTASAMSVFRCGEGRCGEESTFVVNVLRSAGIPARQVYAPHWSHCDDNHAWVEVWCGDTWHYLGACEPEEVLNQGWFDGAASRAMMIHTPYFGGRAEVKQQGEQLAGEDGCAILLNELSRYGETALLQIEVTDEEGKAVKDAKIYCEVMNYASFLEIANGLTNEYGQCELQTGFGTLLLSVCCGDCYGEQLVQIKENMRCQIQIRRNPWKTGTWEMMDCFAPGCRNLNKKAKSAEEKLADAARHLQKKRDTFWKAEKERLKNQEEFSEGNQEKQQEICALIEDICHLLPEKDLREVSFSVLEKQAEWAGKYKGRYPKHIFDNYLLQPRIGLERLTCWEEELKAIVPEKDMRAFQTDPEKVEQYVESRVKTVESQCYKGLLNTPHACLKSGYGTVGAKEILKTALLRCAGIPARLSPIDGRVQAYRSKEEKEIFCWLTGEKTGILFLNGPKNWKYRTDYSVALLKNGQFRACQEMALERETEVPEGIYRICTANRLPNGNVFAKVRYEKITSGNRTEVFLEKKEAALSEMLSKIPLPEFSFQTEAGESFQAAKHAGIYIWAEPGKEPTEHIFNELIERAEEFGETPVYIVAEEKYFQQQTYVKLRETLKSVYCLTEKRNGQSEQLARRMFREPGMYPFILVLRQDLTGIYGEAGYNVGTADMLLRMIQSGAV